MAETNKQNQNMAFTHLVEWDGAKYGVIADDDESAENIVRELAAQIDTKTSRSLTSSPNPNHLSSELPPRVEPMPKEIGQRLGYLAGISSVTLLSFERQS